MTIDALRQALLHERGLPANEVWDRAEGRLDRPLSEGFNSAHEACDRWASDRGRLALIVRHPGGSSDRWTYEELMRDSQRCARVLSHLGLRRGDRVAAIVTRQVEAWIVALAAWRSGIVLVPLFVGFGPDALAQRLNGAQVAGVIVDHRHREAFEGARGAMRDDVPVVTITGPRGTGLLAGDRSFWAEVERQSAGHEVVQTDVDDPATLLFTSGTTSAPKGCVMPHSLVLGMQPFARHIFGISHADLLFSGTDPGWAYGLYTTGAAVMALGVPRVMYTGDFAGDAWLDLVEDERVTYLAAAPSAYRAVANAAARRGVPESLRGATSAGEPLDAPLASRWRELTGTDIQDGYGLSEMAMVLANLAFEQRPVLPGALNSIVPGFEIELVDDEGAPVGEQGLLAIRRPRYQASIDYWQQPKLWQDKWRGDLFLTGDVFRRDENDRWWFVGRDDDVIVTSGYNVGPAEVENVLLAHPEIVDAAAVSADDPARGKVVRAVLVRSGSTPDAELVRQLQDAVRTRIGRHAYPRLVEFVDELPRTETGKLQRRALRAAAPAEKAP